MSGDERVVRYVVRFTGNVQGVGFRMTAVQQSRGLDVHGFVRNEPDGSVRMDVEGGQAAVKELLRRINEVMETYLDDVQVDQLPPLDRTGRLQIAP